MHGLYLDVMAMVAKYGKPDYFITMTANPNWREVLENLEPYQKPHERMDIVCRVFSQKVK